MFMSIPPMLCMYVFGSRGVLFERHDAALNSFLRQVEQRCYTMYSRYIGSFPRVVLRGTYTLGIHMGKSIACIDIFCDVSWD